MSKYGVDHQRASKKSEIDIDQSSFLQEKHYSFSKASQLEQKQIDISGRQSVQEKEPILDFLEEQNDGKNSSNANIQQQQDQQLAGIKGIKFEEIGEEKEPEGETQRDGKVVFQQISKPSDRLTGFFERSRDIIVGLSKQKAELFWNSLRKKGQRQDSVEGEIFTSGGGENSIKGKINKSKSDVKLSQQQDFGNISEIQERKYPRMDDESVQEEEFSSLLNNNNQNNNLNSVLNLNNNHLQNPESNIDLHNKEGNNNENIERDQEQHNQIEEDKQVKDDKISSDSNKKEEQIQNERGSTGKKSINSVQNLGESEVQQVEDDKSKSARGHMDLNQKKRLEEANKRKRELEAELRELEGEIGEIAHPQVKKKQQVKQQQVKQRFSVDHADNVSQSNEHADNDGQKHEKSNQKDRFAIAEDKSAQESALELVRRMHLARKEKESKQTKDRQQFGKIVQEDLRESVERVQQLKEKAINERKERIQSKIEQMRLRSEERRVLNKESNSIIKEIQHDLKISDPTERYKQEVELPELERRKLELAEKRKMYKPIALEEIRDHAKRHDEEIKLRKLQAKTNILAEYGANQELMSLPKSQALHKVLEQDKQFKMKDVLEMQKKKEQIERRKEYAKLVKEVHVPRVKQKNFEEQEFNGDLENDYPGYNIPQRQLPPKPKRPVINYPPLKKPKVFNSNHEGVDSSKSITPHSGVLRNQNGQRKRWNHGDSVDRLSEHTFNEAADMEKSKTGPISNTFDPKAFQPVEESYNLENNHFSQNHSRNQPYSTYSSVSKQIGSKSKKYEDDSEDQSKPVAVKKNGSDYISVLRKQREATEQKSGKKSKIEDWEKYKYDPSLSQKEKYSYILQSAARLEHNAKLKEMQNYMNPELQEQANDLYIDSIKAKLALLDNLNK